MDVGGDNRGVDANLASLFDLLLGCISDKDAVYGLPGGRGQRLDRMTEGGFLESFMGNADTTKAPIAGGVNDMECELIIAVVLHLLHNRTPYHLLCAHSLGSGSDVLYMLGEVLPRQLVYGRDIVKDSADELQFYGMGMINSPRDKGHLFLIPFAHFFVAPFFSLRVISIDYTSFITT